MIEAQYDPNTRQQMAQAQHNKPRVGFTHNCYTTGLGRLFQETVKFGIERMIGKMHPHLVKYRVNGDKTKYRDGLKNPDSIFVYDDPMFELINSVSKSAADEYLTDDDYVRKRRTVKQSIDMLLMLAFEDIYYRVLLKKVISKLVIEFAQHPEYLELDVNEKYVDAVFGGFVRETFDRQKRHAEFVRLVREAELK